MKKSVVPYVNHLKMVVELMTYLKLSIGKWKLIYIMVYRLNSIKAELDGDTIQYDNGESIWLVTYLAMYDWDNPAPNSTEDAIKIGKVVKEYCITTEEIEEERRLMNG